MASIYPRGSRWWISYTDRHGEVQQKSLGRDVKTRKEAESRRRAIERMLDTGALAVPGTLALGQAIEDFLADKHAKREERTWKHYRKHAAHFEALLPTDVAVDAITAAQLEGYLRERVRSVSKTTANKELTTLRVLWTWLVKRGLATKNPALAVEPYSVRHEPRPICSREDFLAHLARIATNIDHDQDGRRRRPDERWVRELYSDVLTVLWSLGIRFGEACALEPRDVDLRAETITIRSSEYKGPRVLPILPAVRAILEKHLARRPAKPEPGAFERVFSTLDGWPAYNALSLFRRRWIKDHPEDKIAPPHALRHAFSDRARRAGVDLMLRSKGLLGHASVQTTRIYSHEQLDECRAALQQIEAADAITPTSPAAPARPPRS